MPKRKTKSKKTFSQKVKENIYWINGILTNFIFATFVFSASYYLGVVEKTFATTLFVLIILGCFIFPPLIMKSCPRNFMYVLLLTSICFLGTMISGYIDCSSEKYKVFQKQIDDSRCNSCKLAFFYYNDDQIKSAISRYNKNKLK